MSTPTIGRIVQYRQRYGMQTWLPAVVLVTSDTYQAGFFVNPNTEEGAARLTLNNQRMDPYSYTKTDSQGEVWVSSPLHPVKEGMLHLKVFSPGGQDYIEYNVSEGEEPGNWKWPEIVN